MPSSRVRHLALVVAVLALVAGACRGGGDETAQAPEATGDEASAAATSDVAPATGDAGASDAAASDGASGTEGATGSEDGASTPDDGASAGGGEVSTDAGVTAEPCPDAVNADNGCIYLGTLSDLTVGPFSSVAPTIVDGQAAFWRTVNEAGGIGGYDVDVTTYVRDNQYNPEIQSQVYEQIKDEILAIAQSLGSPTTAVILDDLEAESILAAPASWTSLWLFEDVVIESGTTYCADTMNAVDWAVENLDGVETVMAVHFPGDYGADAAAGARIAAEAHGLEFTAVETTPGADNQSGALNAIIQQNPDLLILGVAPTEVGTLIGQASAQGFTGTAIANGPGWNQALLGSAAGPAIEERLYVVGPWGPWGSDTPGHRAAIEALGDVDPNEGYIYGWAWSYPLRAALEAAVANGDLTREGLVAAVRSLESVDYEGMLPEGAGNYSGDPNAMAVRQSIVSQPDPEAPTGLVVVQEFFEGPTVADHTFEGPCYQ